jgi:transcriptional regulator with XRE-family HTH domain
MRTTLLKSWLVLDAGSVPVNLHAEGALDLAGRLRQLRERARKTQEEAAATAGLSVATVRKIETGTVAEPGYFTVLSIAMAIGASHRRPSRFSLLLDAAARQLARSWRGTVRGTVARVIPAQQGSTEQ